MYSCTASMFYWFVAPKVRVLKVEGTTSAPPYVHPHLDISLAVSLGPSSVSHLDGAGRNCGGGVDEDFTWPRLSHACGVVSDESRNSLQYQIDCAAHIPANSDLPICY